MYQQCALITDLDGTIYDWVNFFAPSFRAMVHVLTRETKIDEETIIASFQRVYRKHKSLEYPYSIQELDIWDNLDWSSEEIVGTAIKNARGAFRRVRDKNLHLFPTVKETLEWAREQGIVVLAYTLAPGYQAHKRLVKLRIDHLIDCLIIFESYDQQALPSVIPNDVHDRIANKTSISKVKREQLFSYSLRKPNPEPLLQLLNEFKVSKEYAYVIGDSIEKDIVLAQNAGVVDIWAKYGKTSLKKKNLETIQKISTYSQEERDENRKASKQVKPTFEVNEFSEVKSIIYCRKPSQMTLFR